jgi:alpha-amylase
LFQTFYWNTLPLGTWWDTIDSKLARWHSAGITGLWLPVLSKGQSGPYSMGYDPYDYFDFGSYNQMGTVITRFGSTSDLMTLISDAKTNGFKLIADIVINHNAGGITEWDSISGKYTATRFIPLSGKFPRNYEDFHPSIVDVSDEGVFGTYPDVCHNVPLVKNWLYLQPNSIARYYKDSLGFDGWRFDFTSGYNPSVVKAWDSAAPVTYSIGEYNWSASAADLNTWCTAANSGAFDYPLLFAMTTAFNGNNLVGLDGAGLNAINPSGAFTFVANHDIDTIKLANKLKAYALIMTLPGTPFIFYSDYEKVLSRTAMDSLIWVRKNLAAGTATTLLGSNINEFIFRRNGTPGLVTYLNVGTTDASEKVQTTWANKTLKDYVGGNADVTTDSLGNVTISCKANGYAIYAPK